MVINYKGNYGFPNTVISLILLMATAGSAQAQQQGPEGQQDDVVRAVAVIKESDAGVKTGNKPSTFNFRMNPYYRYDELKNGATIDNWNLFVMTPVKWFGKFDGALVLEGPLSISIDLTDVTTIPPAARTETTGFGDWVLRAPMIFKPFRTGSLNWIPLYIQEFTLPTGSEGVSAETFIVSPGGGFVISSNPRWFLALVQFYDFDAGKSTGQPDISRIRLRYFLQYMVSPKYRIYVMPEFQAIFDFETGGKDSFWIAPEIGWVINPVKGDQGGFVVYAKPGWGIGADTDSFQRDFTFEIGVRWMWNQFPLVNVR